MNITLVTGFEIRGFYVAKLQYAYYDTSDVIIYIDPDIIYTESKLYIAYNVIIIIEPDISVKQL